MTLEIVLAHPAVQALGHALLHFLWQGSLLALLLWAFRAATPQAAARLRYAAATLIMLAMPVSLAVTAAWNPHEESQPAASFSGFAVQHPVAAERFVFPAPASIEPRAGMPGWVVFIWLVGVLLLSARAVGGWMAAQKLKRGATSANAELESIFTRVKLSLRVSAPVRLCTSAMIRVPAALGWLEPFILLPVTALTGLSEPQIRAILAHELAHIRRHDYLVNLLQTAIETVLFYHPAVWWVGRQMRLEREHCCDDIAVTVCGSALEYAGALAEMEQIRDRIPEPALAATGGELLVRIRRLLGRQELGRQELASRYVGAIIAATLVLLIAGSTAIVSLHAAPQDATPAFEVASIKLSPPGTPLGYTRFEPGGERWVAVGAPFRFMVGEAYHLRNDQLIGVPDWMARERYDISAKADGPHTAAELQAMVRNLFADRIKLQFHMDTREAPVYALVQDKGGAKLVRHDSLAAGDQDVATKKDPDPAKYLYVNWTFVSVPMDELAFMLSEVLDRPVVNKTGLAGGYDFNLAFTMPWPAGIPEGPVRGITIDTSGPSVFDVIRNLGLRLEPQKGSVEVMKIDHVEKPSPN